MTGETKRLVNVETGRIVVAHMERADTPWKRTVGLLGRRSLDPDAGMWLEPCNGIHTLGMQFPIDVLFLDAEGRALRLVSQVQPWRICGPVRRAHIVVELPAGTLKTQSVIIGKRYALWD